MSPAEPTRQTAIGQRTGRLRRTLLLVFLFAVVLTGYLLVRHYTSSERIKAIAEVYLQQFTHGRVTIGSASFSFLDGVRLYDMTVDPVQAEGSSGNRPVPPVFSCREAKLTHDLMSTLVGDFKINSIVVSQPTCVIVRDAALGRTTLRNLFNVPQRDDQQPVSMPTIDLRNARITVISRERDDDRAVSELRLSVRALPSRQEPGVYDVVWESDEGRRASGHSQIDLPTGRLRNVRGGLPWMSIEAVMLALDATYDGASAWCELLGLDGVVRASDFRLGGGPDQQQTSSATIELREASISIPIDEHERPLPAQDRYLRFERVNGHVEATTNEIQAEFDGLFHGSECSVVATFRGDVDKLSTLQDVGFEAKITAKGLTLPRPDPDSPPAEVRFINRWDKLVEFYHDYDPRGMADLHVDLAKLAGEGEPVVVNRLLFEAREGTASCRYFPYRLNAKGGSVEYTPEGLWIRDLLAERNGGTVVVSGFMEKPTHESAKEILISGTNILIDDALANSLPSRFRKIGEPFNPQGRLDVEVLMAQPEGKNGMPEIWHSKTKIVLNGVSAAYDQFPYRVQQLTGTLVVAKDVIQVIDVTGTAGDAQIEINGSAVCGSRRIDDLDLSIEAHSVAFGENLFSALPTSLREPLMAFNPAGQFDCETSLGLDPENGTVQYVSHVALEGAILRHEAIPVELHDVDGHLTVTNDGIKVKDLVGRYQDATIHAEGAVTWADGRLTPEFTIRAENLRLDEKIRTALPAQTRQALADWQIDGPISTLTTVGPDSTSPDRAALVRTRAWLSGATIQHAKLPTPLRDVRGEFEISRDVVRAAGIEARFGSAKLHADFDVHRSAAEHEVEIKLSATGVKIDESYRSLLPKKIAGVWDSLRPTGSINLRIDSLRRYQAKPGEPPEWTVGGYVELANVSLPGAADLEGISGVLVGAGTVSDRMGGASLYGELSLTEMTVLGRRLDRIESNWSFVRAADGQGFLEFEPIRGSIYGGMAAGKVGLTFEDDKTEYSLETTIQGMQIQPFLNVPRDVRLADRKPIDARGIADVHVYLSGSVGDASSRQGRGRFEILDGHIYRLPIMLAILNVLHLSVPDEDVFEDARAEFFIAGDRMQLRDISLRGSALGLVGSGSLSLPDQGVDLSFVNVGPRRWATIPLLSDVIEGTSRELVELHVTGPLARPTVQARPFRGIQEEFERLFQRRKPRKIRPAGP